MNQYKLSIQYFSGFAFGFHCVKGFEIEIIFTCLSLFIALRKDAKGIEIFRKVIVKR